VFHKLLPALLLRDRKTTKHLRAHMHLLHLEREQRLHLGGRKTVCLKDRVRPALWVSCRADLPIEVVIVPRKTRGGTIPTRVKEELDRTNVVRRPALALQQEQARDIRVGIRAEAIRATEAGIRVPDLILAHRADIKASKAQDVAQQAMVGNKGKAQGGTLVGRDSRWCTRICGRPGGYPYSQNRFGNRPNAGGPGRGPAGSRGNAPGPSAHGEQQDGSKEACHKAQDYLCATRRRARAGKRDFNSRKRPNREPSPYPNPSI